MQKPLSCDVIIIGAGIVGIATAHYLKKLSPQTDVVLLDSHQPMALTSAQSGENYRNWWPHPVMTAFTDRSIDLMETIARETDNRINLTRRGYALATRSPDIDELMAELTVGYAEAADRQIRIRENGAARDYVAPTDSDWIGAPDGVDVITDRSLIKKTFPTYDQDIATIVHIRRAGSLSGQQLGQHMLEVFKAAGGRQLSGNLVAVDRSNNGEFDLAVHGEPGRIRAQRIVNAAGPFINTVAEMLGTRLPVVNTLQQKIAFEDTAAIVPRDMPFSIDLDGQLIDWSEDERELLAGEQDFAWLTQEMPGAIHCRPDGGDHGNWIKLGWAINHLDEPPRREPGLSSNFPEIVLRGAARLNPALKCYYGKLPRNTHHYGGYYTLTDENWPLIGEMEVDGTFVVGALSGFGTMAACAAGDLCARWVSGADKPDYSKALSLHRYADAALLAQLRASSSRGIL